MTDTRTGKFIGWTCRLFTADSHGAVDHREVADHPEVADHHEVAWAEAAVEDLATAVAVVPAVDVAPARWREAADHLMPLDLQRDQDSKHHLSNPLTATHLLRRGNNSYFHLSTSFILPLNGVRYDLFNNELLVK